MKGIPRTDEWCKRLSLAKQGEKNPMYGKKTPCSNNRRLAILKAKNMHKYDSYKVAIEMLNSGVKADAVSKILGINRGVCFKLKNRSHGIFKVFPELV